MTTRFIRFLIFLFGFSCAVSGMAQDWVEGTFCSSVKVEGRDETKFFSVSISKEGSVLSFGGGAGYESGRSPAPDFGGELLSSENGVVRFAFEDSFSNKGVATVTKTKDGIRMVIEISEVEDARCLPLYGTKRLVRVKDEEFQ